MAGVRYLMEGIATRPLICANQSKQGTQGVFDNNPTREMRQ